MEPKANHLSMWLTLPHTPHPYPGTCTSKRQHTVMEMEGFVVCLCGVQVGVPGAIR